MDLHFLIRHGDRSRPLVTRVASQTRQLKKSINVSQHSTTILYTLTSSFISTSCAYTNIFTYASILCGWKALNAARRLICAFSKFSSIIWRSPPPPGTVLLMPDFAEEIDDDENAFLLERGLLEDEGKLDDEAVNKSSPSAGDISWAARIKCTRKSRE